MPTASSDETLTHVCTSAFISKYSPFPFQESPATCLRYLWHLKQQMLLKLLLQGNAGISSDFTIHIHSTFFLIIVCLLSLESFL